MKTESSLTRLCSSQIHGHVIISIGLLQVSQAHFFIASCWSSSTSQSCNYFLWITTHFANLTFGASIWFLQLLHMWLFRKDYDTICELTFDCTALVALFHRLGRCPCHDDVFIAQGLQPRVEAGCLWQCLRCCRPHCLGS